MKVTTRTKIGLVFIYLAGLGWTAELVLPFVHIPHKAITMISILAAAEICFIIGAAILGKPMYAYLKAKLLSKIR